MGSACIKVTKYFLFLFNLLFFVSMICTSPLPPTETLPWGYPGSDPPETPGCGVVVRGGGWGLRTDHGE